MNKKTFLKACDDKDKKKLKKYLESDDVGCNIKEMIGCMKKVFNKDTEIMDLLIKIASKQYDNNKFIRDVINEGDYKLLKRILSYDSKWKFSKKLIKHTVKGCRIDIGGLLGTYLNGKNKRHKSILKVLIKYDYADPDKGKYLEKFLIVMKKRMKKREKSEPNDKYFVDSAVLIKKYCEKMDCTSWDNFPIVCAVEMNDYYATTQLLKNNKVNPSVDNYKVFRKANKKNQFIANELLKHRKIPYEVVDKKRYYVMVDEMYYNIL